MPNNAVLQVLINARDRTQAAFTRVRRAVNRLDRRMKRVGRRMSSVFGDVRTQVLALAAAIGGLTKLVTGPAEFELQMARVGTLGQEAREAVASLSEEVKRLSVEYGKSPIEIADALFDTISAGASADNAIGILNETLRLSVAGVADLKSTVGGLATVANAFEVTTADGFKDLAEQMNAAQIAAKSTIGLISSNIGKLASTFKEAGISTEEMFVALADVTRNADSTEEASTSLRAALTSILKPADDLKAVMNRLSLPMGKAAFQGRTMGEVFTMIAQEAQRLNIPIQTLIPNVRAMAAVSTLSARNGERFNEAMESMKGLLGELDKSFEDIQGTLSQALKRFKQLVEVLTIEFSGELLRGFREELNAIANKDLKVLQIQAKIAGNEYRIALMPFVDATKAMLNGLMFMLNTFHKLTQMIFLTIDNMIERIISIPDLLRGLPIINRFFTSDLDRYNETLFTVLEEREALQKELRQVNEDIAKGGTADTRFSFRGGTFGKPAVSTDDLKKRAAEIDALLRKIQVRREALGREQVRLVDQGAISKNDGTLVMDPALEHMADKKFAQHSAQIQKNEALMQEIFATMGESNAGFLERSSDALNNFLDPNRVDEARQRIRELQEELRQLNDPAAQAAADALGQAVAGIGKGADDSKDDVADLEKGIIAGMRNAAEAIDPLDDQLTKLGETITRSLSNALSDLFDGIADGTASAKDAIQSFGRTILRVMNDIIAQQIVLNLLSGIPGNPLNIKAAANGAVWEGGFQAFAAGGVVNKPTLGLIGEGRFNEAIVPLPDGRKIPVDLRGNTPQGDLITVNISAVDAVGVERLLSTSNGRRAIQSAMRDARATRRDLR